MKFHPIVHGSNISFSNEGKQATRVNSNETFYDAIIFSSKPIKFNKLIKLNIKSNAKKWRGYLTLGLTSKDPKTFNNSNTQKNKTKLEFLPQFATLINLASHKNFWLKEIPNEWSNSEISFIITTNLNHVELTFIFDNEHQVTFLHYLPIDSNFWLVLDLYGQTDFVEIIKIKNELINKKISNDSIPSIVLLNGPNSVDNYKLSCSQGSIKYNSGRIFLIGPSKSGKTFLKNILLDIQNENKSNNPLDTSYQCFSNGKGKWTNDNPRLSNETNGLSKDEQYENLIYNLIKLILNQKKNKQNENDLETKSFYSELAQSLSKIFKNNLKFSIINNENDELIDNDIEFKNDETILPESIKQKLNSFLTQKTETFNEENNKADESKLVNCFTYQIYDFSGSTPYFFINQTLLSSHAIYLLVVDITEDIEISNLSQTECSQAEIRNEDLTTLKQINYWLSVIYSRVGNLSYCFSKTENEEKSINLNNCLTNYLTSNQKIIAPKVIIIATNQSTNDETRVKELFNKIENNLKTKPYNCLVHNEYIEVKFKNKDNEIINKIKLLIDEEFLKQKLINNLIPFSWLEFEKLLKKLVKRGIYFVDYMQLAELVKTHIEIHNYFSNNFNSDMKLLLNFYHLHGKIFCFNTIYEGYSNESLIVLEPIWLINCFYEICNFILKIEKQNENLKVSGYFKEELWENIWLKKNDQKQILIGCLEKLDYICEFKSYYDINQSSESCSRIYDSKLYIFPWLSQILPELIDKYELLYDNNDYNSLKLYLDFNTFLPIGFFSRLVVRLSRWSWNQGWDRKSEVCHSQFRFAVSFDHDIILKLLLQSNRIELIILKLFDITTDINSSNPKNLGPSPNVCVKVRHLIESELEFIQNVYYPRTSWNLKVKCPCDLKCKEHNIICCEKEKCIHFLFLDECLNKKFIECDYRQVRTSFISRFFPQATFLMTVQRSNNGSEVLLGGILNNPSQSTSNFQRNSSSNLYELINGLDSVYDIEPNWLREAAKQLNKKNDFKHNWVELSKRLGYLAKDIKRLRAEEEQSPALALLRDWFESNGRTRYCVDILISCLQIIERDDVKEIIEAEIKPEGSFPPIFLSYQWQSQDQVLEIRRKLELAGFPCWMDMNSIKGGDQLYGKIYEGISNCKVVICFLTSKYSASRSCQREITLADVLHKPILPVMLEPTIWPPPGPIALIMSSLVYIDLCGIGGHGGIGRKGDNESRFREILDRLSKSISGYVDLPLLKGNYVFSDFFEVQQSTLQDPNTIVLLSTNNSESFLNNLNGLFALQSFNQLGVDLRFLNTLNDFNTLNNSQSINKEVLNESDATNSFLIDSANQLLNKTENEKISSMNGNLITTSNSKKTSVSNSDSNFLENTHNLNDEEILEANPIDDSDKKVLSLVSSPIVNTNNQISNCSVCNII